MAWEARPEGALSRWCVVEVPEDSTQNPTLRVVADDLSKEEAHRIADAAEWSELAQDAAFVLGTLNERGLIGKDAGVGPEDAETVCAEVWTLVEKSEVRA